MALLIAFQLTCVRMLVVTRRAKLPATLRAQDVMDSSPESPRCMFIQICGIRPPSEMMAIVLACMTASQTCHEE